MDNSDITQMGAPSQRQQPVVDDQGEEKHISISGHPEQGSMTIESPDGDEEQHVVSQEVSIQASQPAEIILPSEVKAAGVEQGEAVVRQDLSQVVQAAGAHLAKEEVPLTTTSPVANTNLPWSEQKALEVKAEHKRKWRDAIRWLSELILYQWQRIKDTSGQKGKQ